MTPTIQLGRDGRPPTVDVRYQNHISLHNTLHSETTFQNFGVQKTSLRKFATENVHHPPHV